MVSHYHLMEMFKILGIRVNSNSFLKFGDKISKSRPLISRRPPGNCGKFWTQNKEGSKNIEDQAKYVHNMDNVRCQSHRIHLSLLVHITFSESYEHLAERVELGGYVVSYVLHKNRLR